MIKGAVSGYFNPLHEGHVRMIKDAKSRCDYLVVIINNDTQQLLKKGKIIMTEDARCEVVAALRDVDEVFLSIDEDSSVCESLRTVKPDRFFNGGDRHHATNVPEAAVCEALNCEMVSGVGGTDKHTSSSEIISRMRS